MRDDLRYKNLLPTLEPYKNKPSFHHHGFGGTEKLKDGLKDITGPSALVDWLFLEIRDPVEPDSILITQSVLLTKDGHVFSQDGDSIITVFGLQEGYYYVGLRHRNHLGLMADSPIWLAGSNPPLVDFTDPEVQLYGGSAAATIINGKQSLWAGDFNLDGRVIYQGPGNDPLALFYKVMTDVNNTSYLANYISTGYLEEDLNLDGNIIFQGPNNDRAPLLFNTIFKHPANTNFLANFIVLKQLP